MNNQSNPEWNQITEGKKTDVYWGVLLLILVGGALLFFFNSEEKNNTTTEDSTGNSNIVVEDVDVVIPVMPKAYEILEVEDLSYSLAERFSLRVLIEDNPVEEENIIAVSEMIVSEYENKADAVSILFYFDESQADGMYTLAKVDWAPNGDWSQAELGKNQQFDYTYTEHVGTKRTNEPTALEREINTAMRDLWYELMETRDSVTDEDAAVILAPKYGKTVDEMMEIRRKVSNFDMGI